jgi:pimeloyl-ACP methyl ester carboxylesterase
VGKRRAGNARRPRRDDHTLLGLTGACNATALEMVFDRIGAPLEVLRLDEPHIRDAYGRSLLPLRPDLHVFWRGQTLPAAIDELALASTGRHMKRAMRLIRLVDPASACPSISLSFAIVPVLIIYFSCTAKGKAKWAMTALRTGLPISTPHSTLHVIPDCGHLPPIETPGIVADLLRGLVRTG